MNQYLKIFLKWWWLVLACVVLSATTSYFYSQQLPKIYSARVTLTVGNNIIDDPNPDIRALNNIRTLAEVYAELVTRLPIAHTVIERLGLNMDPADLAEMIDTQVIPDAQLLEIYVMDTNPERAQLLANTLAEELISQSPTNSPEREEREKFIHLQINDLQAKIEQTNQKIKAIEDKLPALTSAVEIDEAQGQLAGLETLKASYQQNYSQFLANLSDNSINRLSIFEYAVTPVTPIAPNIRQNTAIAAGAGLLLAVVVIILLEFFDDTVVWRKEKTQDVAGVPVLGAINKFGRGEPKLILHDQLWSLEADMLRNLRSSILLAAKDRSLSTLLVTSASPGEGKSFLAANLSVVSATSNVDISSESPDPEYVDKPVILVDADLRSPSLHELFDLPNVFGLVDVLSVTGPAVETVLQKALRQTSVPGLLLLPAGRAPLDPGSLIQSDNFRNLLRLLEQQATMVIIDSAPMLQVVETRAIVNATDGTVLVVSDKQTRLKNIEKVKGFFDFSETNKLLGVIFNRVKSPYSYQYSAYYARRSPVPKLGQARLAGSAKNKLWPFGRKAPTNPDAIALQDVAAQLGIKKSTARRWCEEGRLPATKEGSHWVVTLDDLQAFITTFQHMPAAEGRNSNNQSQKIKVENL